MALTVTHGAFLLRLQEFAIPIVLGQTMSEVLVWAGWVWWGEIAVGFQVHGDGSLPPCCWLSVWPALASFEVGTPSCWFSVEGRRLPALRWVTWHGQGPLMEGCCVCSKSAYLRGTRPRTPESVDVKSYIQAL